MISAEYKQPIETAAAILAVVAIAGLLITNSVAIRMLGRYGDIFSKISLGFACAGALAAFSIFLVNVNDDNSRCLSIIGLVTAIIFVVLFTLAVAKVYAHEIPVYTIFGIKALAVLIVGCTFGCAACCKNC